MEIMKVHPSQYDEVYVDVESACFPRLKGSTFLRSYRPGKSLVLGVYAHEQWLGYVAVKISEEEPLFQCFNVRRIAVHPSVRRKGLGRSLLAELVNHLDHGEIRVKVPDSMLPVHLFLHNCDYWCKGLYGSYYVFIKKVFS